MSCLARLIRCAIVASGTKKAPAISVVLSPPTARSVAIRFNHRYGPTFTLPKAINPTVAARIMDLARPTDKMSKSASSAAGSLRLLDEPGVLRRKVMHAVTDADGEVAYDPERKPGVSNLLAILAGCTHQEPAALARQFGRYGD